MRPVGPEARIVRHRAAGGGSRGRLGWFVLVAAVVLAVPAAIFLTVRGSADGADAEKVELSVFWWGGETRADLTVKALEVYTKKHPNVTFKTAWQENKGYVDKLVAESGAGNAPDIFQIDDNMLSELAGRGLTLDLSTYVETKRIDLERVPESLAEYGQIDGRTVAVAAAANTPAMAYDRSLALDSGLGEPQTGWTWEKLIDWGASISAKTNYKVYGTMDPSADYKALWMWLRQQKKDLYKGSELGFNEQDLRKWFELWAGARARRATPPADVIKTANSGDVTKQLVTTGQGGTSFVWSNQVPELSKGAKAGKQIGIVAYPGDPSAQWARASMYWGAYQRTEHPEVVADVINFLVNDAEAGRILGTERGLPPNLDVRSLISSSLSGAMQDTVRFESEMADRFGAAPAPPPKGHSTIRALLTEAAESVQFSRATPQQASNTFFTKAKAALGT